MSNPYQVIENIQPVLAKKTIPSITLWNRLEGRPRAKNFDRALKAEVRDALWMLTKQWQLGEFRGDDAGSPVTAKLHMATTRLFKYQADQKAAQAFETDAPLEAKVEQRPVPLQQGGQKMALDLRLMMGRRWLKLLTTMPEPVKQQYREKYPVERPDPSSKDDAQTAAHVEEWQRFSAFAGRAMDGGELYLYLKADETNQAQDGITGLDAAQQTEIENQASRFLEWFDRFFYQPTDPDNNAWMPSYLEYQFNCSAPVKGNEKVMTAEEYYHGRLDWYNLDIDPQQKQLEAVEGVTDEGKEDTLTLSFMPTQLQFEGMPNTRWWEFEDRRTNFGDINPDTTDLNKLLLIEFGLVYANDWFLLPVDLPVGSIADVKGLSVTNVFGERTWIEASGRGLDEAWQRWNMYTLSIKGQGETTADTSLLLLPTAPKIQESEPLEEILFIRDEMANMVWGIEVKIPTPGGRSKRGSEAAKELLNYYKRLLAEAIGEGAVTPPDIEHQANIRYQLMTSVPEHWIPFIPVHMDDSNREIQLQRAAMPRILQGNPDPPEKIRPRTIILREGLNREPKAPYFIHEEEISRAGTRVIQSFQRTRWRDGEVFSWLGVRKLTGRGQGSSGLAFDQIPATETRSSGSAE